VKHTVKFITLGAICAGLALAQHTPPDPSAMAQREVEHLTQRLTLTSAQQAQATTLFTSSQTANQSIMTNLRQAHTALAAAIKGNDANAIASLTTQIGTLTGQMMANTAKADAAFYATLTPDQQAKYTPSTGFGGGPAGGFGGRGPRGRAPQQPQQ
jgi:Spy/CpxP family protein refolding chaperone